MTEVAMLEFGSDAWLDELRRKLCTSLAQADAAVEEAHFSICEVVRRPPLRLAAGGGDIGWWFVIDGRDVEVGRGVRDDLQNRSEGDYERVRATAKIVYAEDPAALAHQRDLRAAVVAAGRAAPLVIPAALESILLELHDHLARRTL